MILSEYINIGFNKIPTFFIITLTGVLYWVFIIWYESKKDGFDDEKMFDLILYCLFFGSGASYGLLRLYQYLSIYKPYNILLFYPVDLVIPVLTLISTLIPIVLFTRIWKWSVFRVLDIFSLAYGLLLFLLSLGQYLIKRDLTYLVISFLIILLYFFILRFRGYKYFSGLIFSILLFFLGIIGITLYYQKGGLIFCLILFMIGILNLYFRSKKTMIKNLPLEFINIVKNKLQKKEKDLEKAQNLLSKEDPYLSEDRSTGNSESMDEAILEDYGKTVTDARISSVKKMKIEVKKALAAIRIGKYGICEKCGNSIDKARLEIYPETTICFECSKKESQENDSLV